MRVLISAYSCAPGEGSESAVGWHLAREAARHHDVWVLTRANQRAAIERRLAEAPRERLRFVWFDLPRWASWWKRGRRGVQLYYYLWQAGAYFRARELERRVRFDAAHHLTFAKYWAPSFLAWLDLPYVWGPVGGAESTPPAFLPGLSRRGRGFERARRIARRLAERDPWVRRTARRSAAALVTGPETAARVRRLGASSVSLQTQVGLSDAELRRLASPREPDGAHPLRFISIGRLVALKGFEMGLRAFARLDDPEAEYWIVGDGPERRRLERLARRLGIARRVRFLGWLERAEALDRLREADVLVHPSLHDSGGLVCVEAMAAGKPVVCLRLGGPALQVTSETGEVVPAESPDQAVRDLAEALERLGRAEVRRRKGAAARRRARERFHYARTGRDLALLYEQVASARELWPEGPRSAVGAGESG